MEPRINYFSTLPVPVNDLRIGTPYYPGTIVIFLYGVRAPMISYTEIVLALKMYTCIDITDIAELSDLGTNSVWFLRLTNEAQVRLYNKLHRLTFSVADGTVTFFMKHLEKIYLLGSLHWVPDTFTHGDVEKIIQNFSTLRTFVNVRPIGGGSWSVLFSPRESHYIPHFVDVYRPMNEHHTLLLALVGRVTPCYFCASYDYRACQCWLRVISTRVNQRKPKLVRRLCRSSTR